jgi:hypothetical protein
MQKELKLLYKATDALERKVRSTEKDALKAFMAKVKKLMVVVNKDKPVVVTMDGYADRFVEPALPSPEVNLTTDPCDVTTSK